MFAWEVTGQSRQSWCDLDLKLSESAPGLICIASYRPSLASGSVEIWSHQTALYNSIYRADGRLFVNQHAYDIPAAHAPVFCFRESERRHGLCLSV